MLECPSLLIAKRVIGTIPVIYKIKCDDPRSDKCISIDVENKKGDFKLVFEGFRRRQRPRGTTLDLIGSLISDALMSDTPDKVVDFIDDIVREITRQYAEVPDDEEVTISLAEL
jgi:hypothetical protein